MQGDYTQTGNTLDLAIEGTGFFQVTLPDGTLGFTRAGSFKLDRGKYVLICNVTQVEGFTLLSHYREGISDDRLKAVTDHVRQWLFAAPPVTAEVAAGNETGQNPSNG